jgi:gliding motility-associated-like protein
VTTDANAPTFEWYLDGVLLTETSNTLVISETGDYSVIVNQTAGCIASQEFDLSIQRPGIDEIPNLISPNGDGINDTWRLPNRILNLPNLKIEILNSRGKKVLSDENYANNWPESEDVFINSNAVFYYIISQDNNVLHQGALTVIK